MKRVGRLTLAGVLVAGLVGAVHGPGTAFASAPTNETVVYLTDSSASIVWDTASAEAGTVNYGATCGSLTGSANAPASDTIHVADLTGLTPSASAANPTTYYYNIVSGGTTYDNGGKCFSFSTLPSSSTPPAFPLQAVGTVVSGANCDQPVSSGIVTVTDSRGADSSKPNFARINGAPSGAGDPPAGTYSVSFSPAANSGATDYFAPQVGDTITVTADTGTQSGTATGTYISNAQNVTMPNVCVKLQNAPPVLAFSAPVTSVNDGSGGMKGLLTAQYGSPVSFTVSGTDAEAADTLTLSVANLPTGLSFKDNGNRTGTVSGTLKALPSTTPYIAQATVNDGVNPPVSENIEITVGKVPGGVSIQDGSKVSTVTTTAFPYTNAVKTKGKSGAILIGATLTNIPATDLSNARVMFTLTPLSLANVTPPNATSPTACEVAPTATVLDKKKGTKLIAASTSGCSNGLKTGMPAGVYRVHVGLDNSPYYAGAAPDQALVIYDAKAKSNGGAGQVNRGTKNAPQYDYFAFLATTPPTPKPPKKGPPPPAPKTTGAVLYLKHDVNAANELTITSCTMDSQVVKGKVTTIKGQFTTGLDCTAPQSAFTLIGNAAGKLQLGDGSVHPIPGVEYLSTGVTVLGGKSAKIGVPLS